MFEIFQIDFMRHAFLAGLFVSIACGMIGTLVVVNRLVFITGGLSHAAYGGIGLAIFLGIAPLAGALGFTVALAIACAWLTFEDRHRSDAVIGLLWSAGMAVGVILIDLTPGSNVNLMSYLFGSILLISNQDLYLIAGLTVFLTGTVIVLYKKLLAMSYDMDFARIRGVPVKALYVFLLIMTAVLIVVMIRLVGLMLVIAFMTIAPTMAEKKSKSLAYMMIGAGFLNSVFTAAGLLLAYKFNLTAGAIIILVAALAFLVQKIISLKPRN